MDRQFPLGEEFLQGICTQKQFDGMKMLVVEVGIDDENKDGRLPGRSLPGFHCEQAAHLSQWTLIALIVRFWMRFAVDSPTSRFTFAARLAPIASNSAGECNGRPDDAHRPLVTSNANSP
jgi:hypothetical protein